MLDMQLAKYMIPIGSFITGAAAAITTLASAIGIAQFFGLGALHQQWEVATAILIAVVLILFLWLRNTQTLLKEELELWCVNKEPKLYRDRGDEVIYLSRSKKQYAAWLRKQWSIPTSEMRYKMFEDIVTSQTNKTSVQKIKDGLKEKGFK